MAAVKPTTTTRKAKIAPGPELSHIAEQLRPLAVPVGDLVTDPANARTHPAKNLDGIAASLRVYGQRKPVVVNKRTGAIEAGNGTLDAARMLGWGHIAAVWVDDDAATAAGFSIADNRTAELAEWDTQALDKLLRECSTGNDPQLDAMLAELAEGQGVGNLAEPGGGDTVPVDEEDVGDEPEDGLDLLFKAPFPWFGGKSRVAKMVWRRFGDVPNYVEPFFGSGAVLLNRPGDVTGTETVNDADGLVCNFWRAVQSDPDKVAHYADWPVNENDLHARHAWLLGQKDTLAPKLEGAPDHFDAKVAGWWVWGMACWIGAGFCSGNGPWGVVEDADGSRQRVHLGSAGQGVNRQLVHLGAGRGVNRKLVHLGAGRGVNRKLVHLGSAGQGVNRKRVHLGSAGQGETANSSGDGRGENGLLAWMRALSERLRRVRVCCGDWTRVCGGDSGDALKLFFVSGQTCGVFLDPPYADTADRTDKIYNQDSLTVAHDVREWAIRHGDDPRLRIALCGYDGEHKMPPTWECVAWKAAGGYANIGDAPGLGAANRVRERVWFSPHCLKRVAV